MKKYCFKGQEFFIGALVDDNFVLLIEKEVPHHTYRPITSSLSSKLGLYIVLKIGMEIYSMMMFVSTGVVGECSCIP